MDNNQNNSSRPRKMHGPAGRMAPGEKSKNFKKAMLQLIRYCKPYIVAIIIAIIFAIVSSICAIKGPDFLKEITNEITKGLMTEINLDKIKEIGIFLIFLYAISALLGYAQSYIMATITNKFSKRMRAEICEKINKLPLKFFDKHSYGDILSRVTNDVDTISQTMSDSIGGLVSSLALFLGALVMMIITNWQMAIAAVISTIIGFSLMGFILSKSQKYFTSLQEEIGNINGHIEEIYSGLNVVKAYNGVNDSNLKFDSINEKLAENAKKSQFISGLMQPLMGFIGNFGYVAVCIVGAILAKNGTIEFGTIVAFMIYIRLFTQPLSQIAQATTQLQSTAAASERVFEFLSENEMTDESSKMKKLDPKNVKGDIEFKHIKFTYQNDDGPKEVIKDFSAKARAGQKIAIVGPTGAGKTTMVNLLMKFYEINGGDIIIDGVSTKDLTRENVHDLFIMVLQDTWLFSGTIKENIIFNKENVTDEQVINACKVVGVDHYIRSLSKGYDTVLNDADNMSAGQKQLITIARGMIKDAPFLILDEATSSVDTRTEELVQKAMDKLTEGRTSFIIAHRLSTIKNADLILVMNDGNIIEQGNHDELMSLNGMYAELYNSQFETVEE